MSRRYKCVLQILRFNPGDESRGNGPFSPEKCERANCSLRKVVVPSFAIVYAAWSSRPQDAASYPFRGNFPRSSPSRWQRRRDGSLISHQLSLTWQLSASRVRVTTRMYARFRPRLPRCSRRRCCSRPRLPRRVVPLHLTCRRDGRRRGAKRRDTTRPYFATFPLPRRIYQR